MAVSSNRNSLTQECEQVGVELFLVRVGKAVGCAFVDLQGRALDELRGGESRGDDRHDLVVIAVDDQGRNVESLQILGEVRLREGLDALLLVLEPT
jgi:hypothetical protein